MPDKANSLTIGGLAKAANVHVETIRYYQRRRLVPEPERPPGGIRRYGPADIERLMFVKTAQQLGFSLVEISDLLQLEDGAHCQEPALWPSTSCGTCVRKSTNWGESRRYWARWLSSAMPIRTILPAH